MCLGKDLFKLGLFSDHELQQLGCPNLSLDLGSCQAFFLLNNFLPLPPPLPLWSSRRSETVAFAGVAQITWAFTWAFLTLCPLPRVLS